MELRSLSQLQGLIAVRTNPLLERIWENSKKTGKVMVNKNIRQWKNIADQKETYKTFIMRT